MAGIYGRCLLCRAVLTVFKQRGETTIYSNEIFQYFDYFFFIHLSFSYTTFLLVDVVFVLAFSELANAGKAANLPKGLLAMQRMNHQRRKTSEPPWAFWWMFHRNQVFLKEALENEYKKKKIYVSTWPPK